MTNTPSAAASGQFRIGGDIAVNRLGFGAMRSQVALAWVLKRSPVMLPIPGASQVAHLEDNVRAADITLSDEDFRALDAQAKQPA